MDSQFRCTFRILRDAQDSATGPDNSIVIGMLPRKTFNVGPAGPALCAYAKDPTLSLSRIVGGMKRAEPETSIPKNLIQHSLPARIMSDISIGVVVKPESHFSATQMDCGLSALLSAQSAQSIFSPSAFTTGVHSATSAARMARNSSGLDSGVASNPASVISCW